MPSWLSFSLVIVAIFFYVALPLVMYSTQKLAANPSFIPIHPSNVPTNVQAALSHFIPKLEKQGFRNLVTLGMPEQPANTETFLVLFVNATESDTALLKVVSHKNKKAPNNTETFVEYSSRFESGHLFETSNAPAIATFKRAARHIKTQVPSVRDLHELYQLHRHVTLQKKASGAKVMPRDGESVPYLSKAITESYELQARAGRMFLNQKEGSYFPTFYGSFCMTWPTLYPFVFLYKGLIKLREQAVLRQYRAEDNPKPTFPGAATNPTLGN